MDTITTIVLILVSVNTVCNVLTFGMVLYLYTRQKWLDLP